MGNGVLGPEIIESQILCPLAFLQKSRGQKLKLKGHRRYGAH